MKKIINLDRNSVARLEDNEPFFIVGNDGIELEFNSNSYDLSKAYMTLQNGRVKRTMKLAFPFSVPQEFIFAGRLLISVDLYIDGNLAKHWSCAPVRLKEIDGDIHAFDELTALESRVADLENKYDKIVKTLSNYGDVINKINEIAAKQNELAETVRSIKENY